MRKILVTFVASLLAVPAKADNWWCETFGWFCDNGDSPLNPLGENPTFPVPEPTSWLNVTLLLAIIVASWFAYVLLVRYGNKK